MGEQRHLIKRQILELKVPSAEQTQAIYSEMSRIHHQRIVPLIDGFCTQLSEPGQIHRIESLEVDLGYVNPENLEAEFIARLSKALPKVLADHVRSQKQRGSPRDPTPKERSHLELFALFAWTGSLPWWADPSRPRLLKDVLQGLIRNAPTPLTRLMRELAREPRSLRRIVLHYDDDILSELCTFLAPCLEGLLNQMAQELVRMLQRNTLAAGTTEFHHRNNVWLGILRTASLKAEYFRNLKPLLREALLHIAMLSGETYDSLVSGLHRLIQEKTARIHEQIRDMAETLFEELHGKAAVTEDLMQILKQQKLGPTSDKFSEKIGMLEKSIEEDVAVQSLGDEAPVDLSFSAADELYIENSGLVILWPFLSHFFDHLGLLQEKRFKEASAVQRAVGLLQYLVTEDPSSPEYLLPLNKVICGMELTGVFDFGPPVSHAEAQECTNLLGAVIAHAPILKNMSIPGFRGTFLLRKGVLNTRDGAWLLRVERETYDVVLDRFPWGWEWVKLPWMEAALRVEW